MTGGGGLLTQNVDKIWTYGTVRAEAQGGPHICTQGPMVQGRNGIESDCRLRTSEPALSVLQNPTFELNLPGSYEGIFVKTAGWNVFI